MATRRSSYSSATGSFIVGYHAALLIGLPFYFWLTPPGPALIVASVILLFLTEIGIGGAYHRYYAHRCFTLSPAAEGLLMALATLAVQGSALRWSFEHRLHHKFVDRDRDPYSIRKGFWYAHMLWLFDEPVEIDPKRVADLLRNRFVTFQDRHYALLCIGGNLLVCGFVGWLVADWLGAFVLAGWTRLLVSHHLTWFVNSLCHFWGEKTFSREQSAVDNYILAFLTVGEGYHNYHHTFASDYRNGFRWFHFDPTKWTIWLLSKLGQARDLKRASPYKIQRRLLAEDRRLLLEALQEGASARRTELEPHVHDLSERIHAKLHRVYATIEELRSLKLGGAPAARMRALRQEIRTLRRSLRCDWKSWSRLCGAVLATAPAPA
jgi:stearoyl-CoA desaturase (delta-9 desaturase)